MLAEKRAKNFTIFMRVLSLLFGNLKFIWITFYVATICNIHFSVRAANLSSCHWYWGETSQYTDDDYLNSYGIADNNNGQRIKMTCNNHTCAEVCPGDCSSTNFYGNTGQGESFNLGTEYPVCTITFRYLDIIFILSVVALSVVCLFELVVGVHMALIMRYPDSKFSFIKNLHLQSIFSSLILAFRPGYIFRFLADDSNEVYPEFPNIPPVPYYFKVLYFIGSDATYLVSLFMWTLFSSDGFSIFLFISSLINFLVSFIRVFTKQFFQDINEPYEDPHGLYANSGKIEEPLIHKENLSSVVRN